MSSPIQSPNPTPEQFQNQLQNLAKKDGLWNGFLVVKANSLAKVGPLEYLAKKLMGRSTSHNDLEKAVVAYIKANEKNVTTEKDLKLLSKLANNVGINGEIANKDIKNAINKIYWKVIRSDVPSIIEHLDVPDILTRNPSIAFFEPEIKPEKEKQEFIIGNQLFLSTNFAELVDTLKVFNKDDTEELEKKFQDLLKTNSNEAKILAIACIQSRSNAGGSVIKNAFPALLEKNPLHAMEFAKELAKKNTIYTTEFRDLLNTLRPTHPEIAKELAMYSMNPYSATFDEHKAAKMLEKKQ